MRHELPPAIESVDSKAKLDEQLPRFDQMVQERLVTLEPAQVIKYRSGD